MKNLKLTLLSILMISPLMAFADQEEILYAVFIQAISIIIFPIILFFIKLKLRQKGVLATVYITATVLVWITTDQMPYRDNMIIINLLIAFGPWLGVAIAYYLISRDRIIS